MAGYVWGDNETQFFYDLDPVTVLNSIDDLGFKTTGRCLTLNSMENRVYEIELDDGSFVVAKFYRPGRWSEEQILAEHKFLLELEEAEIPVIAPIKMQGKTLFRLKGDKVEKLALFFTIFPRKGGRAPEEMNEEQLQIMGRLLARIHNVGETSNADSRVRIDSDSFGISNLEFLLKNNFLPPHYKNPFEKVVRDICDVSKDLFKDKKYLRIHGDCHKGNVIMRPEGPYFIDFDDMLMGPAIQDIWLVTPATDMDGNMDREILIEAYQEMRSFNRSEIKLIEPLRSLRIIHFCAWIAKRSKDPAFQNAFPHFGTEEYWANQVHDLTTQLHVMRHDQNARAF
tara:strand:+ start:35682 stop:36701 length:1020 start_codon:yes stop_codon:yes gene_type:complete